MNAMNLLQSQDLALKQFRYSAAERVILLKELINVNPFDVEHGNLGKTWDEVRENFLKAVPRARPYGILVATIKNTAMNMIKTFRAGEAESL